MTTPDVASIVTPTEPITLGEDLRVAPAESVWQKVWPLRKRVGVTRFAELTELDRLGVPVVAATRAAVRKHQNSTALGCAADVRRAALGALMEAVERHAGAAPRPLRRATADELEREGRPHVSLEVLAAAATDMPAEWIEARQLRTGRPYLLPAAEVLFPYEAPPGVARPMRPSTGGLAAGNTRAEALLHALFEVVERAASSQLGAGHTGRAVAPDSLDGEEGALVARLCDAGVEILIIDLGERAPLPVYKVFSIDHAADAAHLAVRGQGAHLDARRALRRALFEVIQSRAVAIQGSREDLERQRVGWTEDPDLVATRFALLRALAERGGRAPPPLSGGARATVVDALTEVVATLEAHGYMDVYWTDLTVEGVGIPVVHACVPGLVDTIVDPARVRDVP